MSGFSDKQTRALLRSVTRRHIRARVSDGKELSYIEGWFAIAQANRIFGFDGWDRETVEAKCVQAREVRGSHYVLYAVRVRITVRPGRARGCSGMAMAPVRAAEATSAKPTISP